MQLPNIVAAAKRRPLSYNPETKSYIYYDDVAEGKAKLYPIEKLSESELRNLIIKRQLTNPPNTTSTLQGAFFSNEELAEEIQKGSKIGEQMFRADKDYLEFFLSQFPNECFDK